MKAQGTAVKDTKVLFYGAGSSAVGVANMIASLLQKEGGLSEEDAKKVQHCQNDRVAWPLRQFCLDFALTVCMQV